MTRKRLLKLTAIAAVFLGLLFFSGCVGTTALGVLDESVPQASLSNLELRNSMRVVLYDNQPVDWGPTGLTNSRATISIPSGNHTFMLTWVESVNHGGLAWAETRNATIEQECLPGHNYRIYQQKIWLLFFTITNIKVKEIS